MSEPETLDLRKLRTVAVVNTASGGSSQSSLTRMEEILNDAGLSAAEIRKVDSADVAETFLKLADEKPDLLIILGGDGTIRCAAEKCGTAIQFMIPLPGGTMNMLPKSLYGKRDWETALIETLRAPSSKNVSGGKVGEHHFFCAGIFGSPSLWREAREAIRKNQIGLALRWALHAYHRSFSRKIGYHFGSTTGRAAAVAVICPLISAKLDSGDKALEAAALDLDNARQAFGLAWNATFSDWRLNENVTVTRTATVGITSRASVPAILDGEAIRLSRSAEVHFVKSAFTALVPRVDEKPEQFIDTVSDPVAQPDRATVS